MIVLVCETCLKFDLVLKCYITGAASRCSYVSGVKSSCFNSFFSLFVQGSWTLCVRSFKLKVRHVCKRGLIGITFRALNYIFLCFKTNLRTSELCLFSCCKYGTPSWFFYQHLQSNIQLDSKIFSKNICRVTKCLTYPAIKSPVRKFFAWTFRFLNHLCEESFNKNKQHFFKRYKICFSVVSF